MSAHPPANGSSVQEVSRFRFFLGRRKPLRFLDELGAWPGDVAQARIGPHSVSLLKHPDLVQQLLVAEAPRVEKGRTLERALFFQFLGNGLLNSIGDTHRRQRRLMLPAFHRNRLNGYAEAMAGSAESVAAAWRAGEVRDIGTDMMALTLSIVSRTLFSADPQHTGQLIAQSFNELTANVNRLTLPGAKWLLRSPLPFARRIRGTQAVLNGVVHSLIRQRRADGIDTGDLLSMLLLAEDADHPGERLSDEEVRDQVMTLFFAGQETTANALTWIWWLLAQHPEQESALHAELEALLGGRAPSFADVPRLLVTEQLIREALRLYPPIWAMGRLTLADLEFSGCTIPRRSLVVASQWRIHRDPRWFPEPDVFKPERWTSQFRSTLPRFAYFPFGGGPRSCLGENFAWTELILVTATLAQRWRLAPTERTRDVKPQAQITLHPDQPVRLRLHPRA